MNIWTIRKNKVGIVLMIVSYPFVYSDNVWKASISFVLFLIGCFLFLYDED